MPVETRTITQAYRFALDPSPRQVGALMRHAGARRFAYNHAVAELRRLRAARSDARQVDAELPRWPSFFDLNTAFNAWKKTDDAPPWLGENSSQVYLWAIYEARDALKRYFDSYKSGAARRVGFPRFRSKKRDTPRFKVTAGGSACRPVDSRHVHLPRIGSVRVHESMRKLTRRLTADKAKLKNATVSRSSSGRWFISFTAEIQREIRTGPSRRQRASGTIGVDVGVKVRAALSTGEVVANPRCLAGVERRLKAAQRALSRCQKGSARRRRAVARVGRLHARAANLRREHTHQLTTRLVHAAAVIGVEDLAVKAMTASARGTIERPGRRVRQKAGLNRAILDAAFGEIRRQLTYKTTWYGSRLAVIDRWEPTSKSCSACEWRNPNLTLADRMFHCGGCGLVVDRDVNAARNIAAAAARLMVAPSGGETQNARRVGVSPGGSRPVRQPTLKREAGTDIRRVGPAPPAGNGRTSTNPGSSPPAA